MTNLIGEETDAWAALAGEQAGLHLYGKAESRPGRKMGHVTRLLARALGRRCGREPAKVRVEPKLTRHCHAIESR